MRLADTLRDAWTYTNACGALKEEIRGRCTSLDAYFYRALTFMKLKLKNSALVAISSAHVKSSNISALIERFNEIPNVANDSRSLRTWASSRRVNLRLMTPGNVARGISGPMIRKDRGEATIGGLSWRRECKLLETLFKRQPRGEPGCTGKRSSWRGSAM